METNQEWTGKVYLKMQDATQQEEVRVEVA